MCLPIITQEHQEEEEDTLENQSEQPCRADLPMMNSLDVMLQQESKVYRSQCLERLDIAVLADDDNANHVMDWFRQMTEFCFAVVDCCELPLQSVEVAMNLLDRFLFGNNNNNIRTIMSRSNKDDDSSSIMSIRQEILSSSSQFQLATLTCLWISTKLFSTTTKCLKLTQLQRLSRNMATTAEDFQSMELKILCQLDFQINPPTIVSLAQQYVQEEELDLWKQGDCGEDHDRLLFFYLVEQQARLATCELYSFHVPVSSIAMACVKNALEIMNERYRLQLPSSMTLESKVVRLVLYYHDDDDDQRDVALVQEQLQSRLRGTALEAMEQWRTLEDDNAMEKALWLSNCTVAAAGSGISKTSSSPTTVLSPSSSLQKTHNIATSSTQSKS